jgi:hypothetical protein
MNPNGLPGIEGICGNRDDKDDSMGTVFRSRFTSRVNF